MKYRISIENEYRDGKKLAYEFETSADLHIADQEADSKVQQIERDRGVVTPLKTRTVTFKPLGRE